MYQFINSLGNCILFLYSAMFIALVYMINVVFHDFLNDITIKSLHFYSLCGESCRQTFLFIWNLK